MSAAAAASFPQIDASPLNRKQKGLLLAAMLGTMLEFFDFFIIAYVVTLIAEPWGLTTGQTGLLLISAGASSILGSLVFGWLADQIGRRKVFMATVLIFSLATGAMALVPEGEWVALGVLRFIVGLGVGGLVVVDVPLVQEFVPAVKRGVLGGAVVLFIPMGSILGSLSAAYLAPTIGWRGLVLLGLLPAFISLYVRFQVKESPTWLLEQGREEEARESVGWVLGIRPDDVQVPNYQRPEKSDWRELFAYRRSLTFGILSSFALQLPFYGIVLWGPSLVGMKMDVTPADAAKLMIAVNVAGLLGRILAARLSESAGRRMTGAGFMGLATTFLLATALGRDLDLMGTSGFYVFLIAGWFFLDGSFSVALPYWAEHFPTRMRSAGTGVAYGIGGLGKIIGPAVLVLISGAGTAVEPEASNAAILPAFLLFAGVAALGALSYLLFAVETKGLDLDELEAKLDEQVPRRSAVNDASEPTREEAPS